MSCSSHDPTESSSTQTGVEVGRDGHVEVVRAAQLQRGLQEAVEELNWRVDKAEPILVAAFGVVRLSLRGVHDGMEERHWTGDIETV